MTQKIHQQKDAGRNDRQPDQLGRSEQLEYFGIVAPQKLVEKAERTVKNQIAGHRHAARRPAQQIEVEKHEQKLPARLVQLHRMQRRAGIAERRFAALRIADAPEKFGRLSVTAAIEKTADPAAGVRQSDRRRVRVENAHDVEFLTAGEDPERRDCQQKTAVEHQSALIDPDDPPEVIPVLVEKLDDVKDSRPDDSGNHRDEERGGRLIGGHSRIFAGPADQPGGEQKADRRHQPVTAE